MFLTYPSILLPKKNYKFIDCDVSDRFLIRLINREKNEPIKDALNNIFIKFICSPEALIQDLSTSLLGNYTIDHTRISLTKEGASLFGVYCNPNFEGQPLNNPEQFAENPDRLYWVIGIKIINELKAVEITRQNNKTKVLEVFNCSPYVEHTPTKCNFWHYSVRWKANGFNLTDIDYKERQTLAQKIGHKVRVNLSRLVKDYLPPGITELPVECYTKEHN